MGGFIGFSFGFSVRWRLMAKGYEVGSLFRSCAMPVQPHFFMFGLLLAGYAST